MTKAALILRLGRPGGRELPDPADLLERAFPADAESRAPGLPRSLTSLASAALVVAASTPIWTEPSCADRERTAMLVEATMQFTQGCQEEWKAMKDHSE